MVRRPALGWPSIWLALLLAQPALVGSAIAEPYTHLTFDATGDSEESRIIQRIVLASIPRVHDERPNWGNTVHIFDGFDWKRDGFRIKVSKRKKKEVNHGLWKHYRVTLVDPEKHLHVVVKNTRQLAEDRFAFQVFLSCKLDGYAEFRHWNNGIKLFSVDTEGDADVEMTLDCEVTLKMTGEWYLPSIEVSPKITRSQLTLRNFTLRRFGHGKGPIVREIGNSLEGAIQRMMDEQEPRIVDLANKELAEFEEEGKLKFSSWKSITDMIGKLDRKQASNVKVHKTFSPLTHHRVP
ncbi:hypothetical protein Pan216_05870 [Planctomycetes bacterium Pan216]|uniref:Uncharacterized protein n=1 Tax=Kolteria novifilia TaxID=2527975 RepID=A0A518AYF0_9BACT|nr:hypothetical protein Pan216_05870 [Planctomycetes bacterium Pan216]